MTDRSRRRFLRTAAVAGTGGLLTLLGRAADPAGPRSPDDFISPETQSAIDRGLQFLAQSQANDGSFGDRMGGNTANAAVTALAGLALLSGGHHPGRGRYGKQVSRAVDYIVNRGRTAAPVGYLQNADTAGHGAIYQHGFSTLFLSEVHGTLPDPDKQAKARDMLEKAVAVTVKAQNRKGGWRYEPRATEQDDVSVTVAQLMALRAAKNAGIYVDKAVVDKCVEYIKGCQLPDGGFMYIKGQSGSGSLFPRSAAAVVGLYSAGVYDDPVVEKGLRYLMRYLPRGNRGGFDIRQEHYFYGQYYAALAMWTAGGNYWAEWYPAIRNELLLRREQGGGWSDFFGSAYATAMACIILQLPNNYLPIMQK